MSLLIVLFLSFSFIRLYLLLSSVFRKKYAHIHTDSFSSFYKRKTSNKIDFSFFLFSFFLSRTIWSNQGADQRIRSGVLSFIPMSNAMLDLINISVVPNLYQIWTDIDSLIGRIPHKKIILLSACKDSTVDLRSRHLVLMVFTAIALS